MALARATTPRLDAPAPPAWAGRGTARRVAGGVVDVSGPWHAKRQPPRAGTTRAGDVVDVSGALARQTSTTTRRRRARGRAGGRAVWSTFQGPWHAKRQPPRAGTRPSGRCGRRFKGPGTQNVNHHAPAPPERAMWSTFQGPWHAKRQPPRPGTPERAMWSTFQGPWHAKRQPPRAGATRARAGARAGGVVDVSGARARQTSTTTRRHRPGGWCGRRFKGPGAQNVNHCGPAGPAAPGAPGAPGRARSRPAHPVAPGAPARPRRTRLPPTHPPPPPAAAQRT